MEILIRNEMFFTLLWGVYYFSFQKRLDTDNIFKNKSIIVYMFVWILYLIFFHLFSNGKGKETGDLDIFSIIDIDIVLTSTLLYFSYFLDAEEIESGRGYYQVAVPMLIILLFSLLFAKIFSGIWGTICLMVSAIGIFWGAKELR